MTILTADQQKAWDDLFAFILSDKKYFLLYGKPGTGKTFLMNKFSNEMIDKYKKACNMLSLPVKYEKTTFLATTNKAAEVLARSTARPTRTVHSFLNLKAKNNYKTGKVDLIQTQPKAVYKEILFIDEASMIDADLLNFISLSTPEAKVVFVGDAAQLAPVGEQFSPIFKLVDDSSKVFLQQPVRNADAPALIDLCEQFRRTVKTGKFEPIKEVRGFIEYLPNDDMQDALEDYFVLNDKDARILCYSNNRVQLYNSAVREMQGKNAIFDPGEELIMARNYFRKPHNLSVERHVKIVHTDNIVRDGGFQTYTPDGKQIQYVNYDIGNPGTSASFMQLSVPLNYEYAAKTLANIKRKKDWPLFFSFTDKLADVRPKYASTVYKAQGSTYDTVFIDLGNIGTSRDPQQVARMLLVAVSRAQAKIYLFGQLPGKYTTGEFQWTNHEFN